ncbi:hypothetical protein [Paenibacillus glucanolyticus]|uniref:hypothetical protein n=1 Tax=Paenibacillus glucanolyticus TaxID=59843 RepID=UPI00096C8E50|nr:hypothetical protein [Paenibacillus glucanolyticus]OMF76770.1 hypothetical protein BK142_14725 [Paenibacillus glucanolyticus]
MNDLLEKLRGELFKAVKKIKPDITVTALGDFNEEGFEKTKKAHMDDSNVLYRTPPKTDGAVFIVGEVNDHEHFEDMLTTMQDNSFPTQISHLARTEIEMKRNMKKLNK